MKKSLRTGWYVLYVRSRQEKKVYNELIENGLEAFLPMVTSIRKWSDRTKKIEIPLFASYVFVKIESKLDFYKASDVDGACTFIKFANEYALAKEEEINSIKLLISTDGLTNINSSENLPSLGEFMKISEGPLEGLQCEVLRVDNAYKILVSINSLKQNIVATVPVAFLEISSNAISE